MNTINTDNCEAYFLDYYEGRLSKDEIASLRQFLAMHPEWQTKFEDWENIHLPNIQLSFPEKEWLKHPSADEAINISFSNYEYYFIAALEGELTQPQRYSLDLFLKQHPELEKEFDLYALTRLKPQHIPFPDKKQLLHKKKNIPLKYFVPALAAAAAIMLLILFQPSKHRNYPPASDRPFAQTSTVQEHSLTPLSLPSIIPSTEEKTTRKIQPAAKLTSTSLPQRQVLIPIANMPSKEITNISIHTTPPEVKNIHRIQTAIYMEMIAQQQNNTNEDRPHLLAKIVKPVVGLFQKKSNDEMANRNEEINLWTLAEYTIKGFNAITQKDIEWRTQKDEEGKIVALAIEGENFKIARVKPQKQEETEKEQ
ncbi:MAG TPA: hypothetical protein PK028_02485 [Bacteroidales bacterium]|jgi:hypothetical protein|nr:hypothetical protein [Bacteroidales bacterium]MDI9573029.1 hypothetical protein [Bacteroidota bacterium]OQC59163.1 MAG: hypothetical protein BWX51_01686 [Bacteroidetes bacterium ADurb.Bin012]MBP9511760.1 hypothetical protein [Bacteroidales bacterium]MBP9588505.1 hypothetical protein [Bacteroidales bacterium]